MVCGDGNYEQSSKMEVLPRVIISVSTAIQQRVIGPLLPIRSLLDYWDAACLTRIEMLAVHYFQRSVLLYRVQICCSRWRKL